MTADNVTSSRLRELSRLASPAPWDVGRTSINGESLLRTDKVNDFSSRSVQMQTVNAELIVALRNDAEKYADLRDAVKAYKDAVDAREALADADGVAGGEEPGQLARYYIAETNAYSAMLAALAALGGEE